MELTQAFLLGIMVAWTPSSFFTTGCFGRSDLDQPLMRAELLISFGPVLMAVVRQMSQEACQSVSQGFDGKKRTARPAGPG